MASVHFGTFLSLVERAYAGNGKGSKKALYQQLKAAKKTGASFPDFLDEVKDHALESAKSSRAAVHWKDGDTNLLQSFQTDKGDALKAAAFHFYFLAHEEHGARAEALNDVIDLPKLMNGEFETAVFGSGIRAEADASKRRHPVPPRPTAHFHWPLYVSEQDANSPDADVGVWLNPLNHFSIPLSHRQKEKELLDAFVADDRPFLICALVAPSGAGKTRLVSEWMYDFVPEVCDTEWDAGFVNDRSPEPWEKWPIERNTLIVIDYTYAYDEVMKAIAERCRYHRDAKKVRLLVIDHVYPQVLQSDFFWQKVFPNQSVLDSRKSSILFADSPIVLAPEGRNSTLLRDVIAAAASSPAMQYGQEDEKVVQAESLLAKMADASRGGNPDSIRHPLFAALLGQAIRDGRSDYQTWSRRDLIKHYFDKPYRLPWRHEEPGSADAGMWIGAYVSCATLLRDTPIKSIRKHLPQSGSERRSPLAPTFIQQAANRIVSSSNTEVMKPLMPDILGENFLIQFFLELESDEPFKKAFVSLLNNLTSSAVGTSPLFNFIETMHRLVRNLLNDEQTPSPDGQKEDSVSDSARDSMDRAWRAIDALLTPDDFPSGSFLRQAVSIVRADASLQCFLDGLVDRSNQFADGVNITDMHWASAGPLWKQAAISFIHLFDLESAQGRAASDYTSVLTQIAGTYDARLWLATMPGPFTGALSEAFMLASSEGRLAAAQAIYHQLGVDVRAARPDGYTALALASANGQASIAEWLINVGADVNRATGRGWTPLMLASYDGHIEVVRTLLVSGAEVNRGTNDDGWTALMLASNKGHSDVMLLLLANGATIDQGTSDNSWTALMAACFSGHAETAGLLIDHGADVNRGRIDGFTALMAASEKGHTENVQLLLDRGGQVNRATVGKGKTALLWACEGGFTDAARLLLDRDANPNLGTTDQGWTALMSACRNGHAAIVTLLLEHGADVDQVRTSDALTALMAACEHDRLACVQLLLEHGADPNRHTTENGWTALISAGTNGNSGVTQLLVDYGADINHGVSQGWTALMAACKGGHTDVVRILLKSGAFVNQRQTNSGWTALMAACREGHVDAARLLLEHGADVNLVRTDNGWTALMAASIGGHTETARVLIDNAANVNQARTDTGVTALIAACQNGHKDTALMLLDGGAGVNQMSGNGWTALMWARHHGHMDVADLLMQRGAEPNGTPLQLA